MHAKTNHLIPEMQTAFSAAARHALTLAMLVFLLLVIVCLASAQTETVLHNFDPGKDGSPTSGVTVDAKGNLYGVSAGTTFAVVYKLSPSGRETILRKIDTKGTNGFITGTMILDNSGNLYGTDMFGGVFGMGDIFRITPSGKLTVLHSFQGSDGANPYATLVFDKHGSLYGTTINGGAASLGTVFKLSSAGALTTLWSFHGADGANPGGNAVTFLGLLPGSGPLAFDRRGNIYGTTTFGGVSNSGTAFMLTPAGVESVLRSFPAVEGNPNSGLALDCHGNLYGTTPVGGAGDGFGTIFKITAKGIFRRIHTFDPQHGGFPLSGLIIVHDVLYGVDSTLGQGGGSGVLYKSTLDGVVTVLHAFTGSPSDGSHPVVRPSIASQGNLYGTTDKGGMLM